MTTAAAVGVQQSPAGEPVVDLARIDAVTIDAHGTLVELDDAPRRLADALAQHGVVAAPDAITAAFRAEVAYYTPRAHEARDAASLAALQADCTRVFLHALEVDLDAASFAPAFVSALVFRPLAGTREALAALRSRGLAVAVVSNWDVGLAGHLEAVGIARHVDALVTSADAGAPKPDPRPFELALEQLGVGAGRAVHIGDDKSDAAGAAAAGMRFVPAPVSRLLAATG